MQYRLKSAPNSKPAFMLVPRLILGFLAVLVPAIYFFSLHGERGGVAGFLSAGVLYGALILGALGALAGALVGVLRNRNHSRMLSGVSGLATGLILGALIGILVGHMYYRVQITEAAESWDKGSQTSSEEHMQLAYQTYVQDKAPNIGKNIVEYTSDARQFFLTYENDLKLSPAATDLQNAYEYVDADGMGGRYTLEGRTMSFWYPEGS